MRKMIVLAVALLATSLSVVTDGPVTKLAGQTGISAATQDSSLLLARWRFRRRSSGTVQTAPAAAPSDSAPAPKPA
jgi:hypothetical protein